MSLISKIIDIEWEMFQDVKNEGGQADCQRDQETFRIMRYSQFKTWPDPLLESYEKDLEEGKKSGWNLLMEKYARMMKTTTPEKYKEIEHILPALNQDREELMEEIIKVQVRWMEQFAKEYPGLASQARLIHTSEDEEENTSYETYLRGEISTYSDYTFKLYCEFIINLVKHHQNLAKMIIENTVKMYGYDSLYNAQKGIKN